MKVELLDRFRDELEAQVRYIVRGNPRAARSLFLTNKTQDMNLRSEVLILIQEERDNDLLAAIRELLLRKDSDWWDRIGTAERASIKRGIAEADAGMGVSHQEAMKPYGKWL